LIRACEKTGLSSGHLETLAEEIEAQLQGRSLREIASSEIGELVLLHLRPLSEVAYVRFASVYRQFRGIRDFVDTLNHLQNPLNESESQKILPDFDPDLSDASACDRESPASCATPS
jgi:transcriptional repressor NrdR